MSDYLSRSEQATLLVQLNYRSPSEGLPAIIRSWIEEMDLRMHGAIVMRRVPGRSHSLPISDPNQGRTMTFFEVLTTHLFHIHPLQNYWLITGGRKYFCDRMSVTLPQYRPDWRWVDFIDRLMYLPTAEVVYDRPAKLDCLIHVDEALPAMDQPLP